MRGVTTLCVQHTQHCNCLPARRLYHPLLQRNLRPPPTTPYCSQLHCQNTLGTPPALLAAGQLKHPAPQPHILKMAAFTCRQQPLSRVLAGLRTSWSVRIFNRNLYGCPRLLATLLPNTYHNMRASAVAGAQQLLSSCPATTEQPSSAASSATRLPGYKEMLGRCPAATEQPPAVVPCCRTAAACPLIGRPSLGQILDSHSEQLCTTATEQPPAEVPCC